MHLTLFTDYALRSLMYLSAHGDGPCTVEEIAGYFKISADHVTKVMQHLARRGYVRSRRGRNGGAMLARSPDEIRLGDVLRDFEEISLLNCMHTDKVCTIGRDCLVKQVLAEGQRRMMAFYDEHSLQDLASPLTTMRGRKTRGFQTVGKG